MAQHISDHIRPGSWILEQLTLQLPDVEMAAGRRAWYEAQSAWPGQERRLWWKWASEAAESIGLATKTIDCSIDEALRLVYDGAQIISWRTLADGEQGDGHWIRVRQSGRHRFEISEADAVTKTSTLKRRRLKRLLRQFEVQGRVRCVVIRNDVSLGVPETHDRQPFPRLMALLKPEWPDIWIVMVFAFVVGLLMLATPIAVEALVNTVAFGRFLQPVVVLALILLTFLTFSAAMRALQTYVVEIVQRRLFARVAGDLAYRLPRARTEATDGLYLPELTNRFFDIVTVQKVSAQLFLDGIGLVLTAVIGMAVLAFYHPWLLGFDVVMMASIAFIIFVLGRGAVSSAIKESKHKYSMASWLEDISRCEVTFRTAGGSDLALERTDRIVHEYLEARQKHFGILMRQILFALGLQAVASTVLLGLGGWLVIAGQLTLGQLVAAELIVTTIVGAFAKLGKHMESFYDLLAAVDKLGVLFDIPTEHHDGVLEFGAEGPASLFLQSITYTGHSGGALAEPVTVDVPAAATCAVLGRSGSGKSTIVDLICGQRLPTRGHITIDGMDPRDLRPDVLRSQVAVVRPSEIFHGTLEENVHLHRSDVTSADVRFSMEAVGLQDHVLTLSSGFETVLDGGGAPLSHSQKDLVCLARGIAGRPRLLLIDGLLDGLSDQELSHVLEHLLQKDRGWTVLITTGRRDIAERCDQTVELPGLSPGIRSSKGVNV
ncbi:MAG: ATP-binding cassette domain-containing protein [Fuerstiella sp.]